MVNLIAAVVLGIFVAVIAMFIIAAPMFGAAMMPEAKRTSVDYPWPVAVVTLAVTGLIYRSMFRKLRSLRPRRGSRS